MNADVFLFAYFPSSIVRIFTPLHGLREKSNVIRKNVVPDMFSPTAFLRSKKMIQLCYLLPMQHMITFYVKYLKNRSLQNKLLYILYILGWLSKTGDPVGL